MNERRNCVSVCKQTDLCMKWHTSCLIMAHWPAYFTNKGITVNTHNALGTDWFGYVPIIQGQNNTEGLLIFIQYGSIIYNSRHACTVFHWYCCDCYCWILSKGDVFHYLVLHTFSYTSTHIYYRPRYTLTHIQVTYNL